MIDSDLPFDLSCVLKQLREAFAVEEGIRKAADPGDDEEDDVIYFALYYRPTYVLKGHETQWGPLVRITHNDNLHDEIGDAADNLFGKDEWVWRQDPDISEYEYAEEKPGKNIPIRILYARKAGDS
jgi:hypothetical protein